LSIAGPAPDTFQLNWNWSPTGSYVMHCGTRMFGVTETRTRHAEASAVPSASEILVPFASVSAILTGTV
jgi:hypothetical protein